MLEELDIRNFAVAEHVRVRFAPGFNAITGETGAGKSIIIDALGLLLGGRADPAFVRSGAEAARVEGIFRLDDTADDALTQALQEAGVEPEDGLLIISREVRTGGRSPARVNGRAVVQATLTELGRGLVDIHGQTDQLSILRASEHLGFLDRYAGLTTERAALAARVNELREVRAALNRLQEDERERARRQDRLSFEVQEIDEAQLRPEEEDELRAERQLLSSAEDLARLADAAHAALTGGGDGGSGRSGRGGAAPPRSVSAVDALGLVAQQLSQLAQLDPRMADTAILADTLQSQAYDLARDLRTYREGVEYNPRRLAQIEERLTLILGLKRKYGATIAEVLAYGERARAGLHDIVTSDERREQLRVRLSDLTDLIGAQAAQLSLARRGAARRLAAAVQREIADLRLTGGRFAVHFACRPDDDGVPAALPEAALLEAEGQEIAQPSPAGRRKWRVGDPPPVGASAPSVRLAVDRSGVDRVEFYVALNPGEPLRPLAKVASGGETARLVLALKTILGAADAVPTLVFDEVDVGIGGRSGQVVGEKLAALGEHHQVLCITHLPQVAAKAGHHLVVAKHVAHDRTFTTIHPVEDEARRREIAAMLGGVTDAHLAAAGELLD